MLTKAPSASNFGLSAYTKLRRQFLKFARFYRDLTPLEKWLLDGWDSILYKNLEISPEDLVLVVGAFHGDSICHWRAFHQCRVVGVEPINAFFKKAKNRFQHDEKVKIFNFGLGNQKCEKSFSLQSDATGAFLEHNNVTEKQTVQIEDARWFFNYFLKEKPKVMEINIEGGEYELVPRLLESVAPGLLPDTLLIQMHKISDSDFENRNTLQVVLEANYVKKFDYPWVWERWDLRTS